MSISLLVVVLQVDWLSSFQFVELSDTNSESELLEIHLRKVTVSVYVLYVTSRDVIVMCKMIEVALHQTPRDVIVMCVQVKLRWPTSLCISPLTDELHILDDNVILKVTRSRKVIVAAGQPPHCSLMNNSSSSTSSSSVSPSGKSLSAVDGRLEHAQNFAFSPDGEMYLVESNAADVNRVRVVDSAGRLRHYIGSQCDCHRQPNCRCNISLLSTPSAVSVTPDGIVHIADTGTACVHSAVTAEPVPDRSGQYEVVYGPQNEVYVFNRFGQHLSTRDLETGQLMYNFTYNGYSHYGRLLKVTDAGGHTLVVRRDYKLVARDISVC